MKHLVLRDANTTDVSEDDVRDSTAWRPLTRRGGGNALASLKGSAFRTLRPKDKIVETSISAKKLSADIPHERRGVQNTLTVPATSEEEIFVSDDRARLILSLLVRKESLDILERVLTTDDPAAQRERLGTLLLSSHDTLYSFSRLVSEGGLTVSEGRLKATELTTRILDLICASKP